ncbi:MAG: hypothetical protein JKY65_07935 [Planctomycetes bacterium]|nr:hypothetical protein [Planctomycetota bacterium]
MILAAELLGRASLPEGSPVSDFERRLEPLAADQRAALWSLAHLGSPLKARRYAPRGTPARLLVDLEARRREFEQTKLAPVLSRGGGVPPTREAYGWLLEAARPWGRDKVSAYPPATRELADVVLDRLQWTIGRCGTVMALREGSAGTGATARRTALSTFRSLPKRKGVGRTVFGLFVAEGLYLGRDVPKLYELRDEALPYQGALLADPAARALYGRYALRYVADPVEALRLGGLAADEIRRLGPISGAAHRLLPEMAARTLEIDYLRLGTTGVKARVAQVQSFLRGTDAAWRNQTYISLAAWHLYRRELRPALKRIEAGEDGTPRGDQLEALILLRGEVLLAQDPAGAAADVLQLLKATHGIYAEEFGLRAHAKALAGLDPSKDLAEVVRLRKLGWRRLGLPWHAFDVEGVIDGEAWWPGVAR